MNSEELPDDVVAAEIAATRRQQIASENRLDLRITEMHIHVREMLLAAESRLDTRITESQIHAREINDITHAAQDKALEAALNSAAAASNKAEDSITKRMEASNGVRAQLDSAVAVMITRPEADVRDKGIYSKIESLSDRLNVFDKRTSEWMAASQGKSTGISAAWGILLGAVGFIAAMVSILARFLAGD